MMGVRRILVASRPAGAFVVAAAAVWIVLAQRVAAAQGSVPQRPAASTGAAAPPSATPAPIDLRTVIPLDPAVRTGTLPNGLRYFVRANSRPAKRVALRLAVKAGSLDEAEDQQGLAHFIEHMAFNGSAHFKPGELVSYFETTGSRLGPHVNAYTSFDETVYMLELPTDKPEVVAKGLTALADFGGGLSLEPEQVDRERGVVIEEWRGRLGASSRIRDRQIPVLYYQSRYAERVPIGKPEVIRNAPVERLRAFYDAWYRPEKMAVIVVGDIDAAQIEAAVTAAFSSIRARSQALPAPNATVPLHTTTLVNVSTDPEVTQSTVQFITKHAREGDRQVADYRRSLVENLFEGMLNDRFTELARKPEAKFIGAGGGRGDLSAAVSTFSLSARVEDGKLADGLAALVTEARRVQEFGFTASELVRAKQWIAAIYDRALNEQDKTESGSLAQEYLNLFLSEQPSPGIAYEHRLVQQLLPSITLQEVAALARARLSDPSRVILATAPEKPGLTPPTEVALTAAVSSVNSVPLTAWTDVTVSRELVEKKPALAPIVSRRELADIGVTVVRFANGAEAWLKPTDFKNDQIVFSMSAPGGASLAPAEDFVDATLATSYVELSGFGGLNVIELEKLLTGKLASASPFVALSSHGVSGSAPPAQLETSLQLLYLAFTAPGNDPDAFTLLKRRLESAVANRGRSPGQVFGERLQAVNTSNHYSARPLTSEVIQTLDPKKMFAFYRQRFANAADFTLVMVGSFSLDTALPLLQQYVGSLPSTGSPSSKFRDIAITFPSGVERVRVEKGREPASRTVISFYADPDLNPVEQETLSAATTVLETSLRDMLREDLGQTYTVSVGLSQSYPQRGNGRVEINFGAAPENIDAMTERVLQEVRRLQQNGPSDDLTTRAKEAAKRSYETALRQNGYWLRRLEAARQFGTNPSDILTRPQRIDGVTPAAITAAFRKYFPLERYTVVTLVPEPGAAPAPTASRQGQP